jgi:GTP-binding protein
MALKLAIVGRPNVGKSTLFNRLAGRKLAIVNDQPGVTRDRRNATGRLGDLDLELIDTAGFEDVDDQSLEARMRTQTERALEEADVALFLIDAREGVTPLDRIFAELIRRRNTPVILAANKAEGRAGDLGGGEAFALGLGAPVLISAEHGEGMSDLFDALVAAAPLELEEEADAPDKPVRIAIVGRPNAGKSTLVNRLIGEQRLLTGPEAGITRDAISVDWDWEGRPVRLVDTAGLRRKARIHETLERLSTADTLRAITFAEVVILVMDAESAFETQDLQIADLVEREGRGLVYCLAKWDLVAEPQARLAALKETAERMLPQLRGTPLVALSAETGRGVERLMPAVFQAYGAWSVKVKTRDLNDWLAIAVQRHPPPAVNGKRIKPKYMAQLKGRPPTFVLFASRAEHLPDTYRRYLINSLRESFDLPGTPIRITIKSGKNPYAEESDGQRKVAMPVRPVKRVGKAPKPEDEGSKLPGKRVSVPVKAVKPKPLSIAQKRAQRTPTTHKLRKNAPRRPQKP